MNLKTAIDLLKAFGRVKKEDKDKELDKVLEEHKLDFVKDKDPNRV